MTTPIYVPRLEPVARQARIDDIIHKIEVDHMTLEEIGAVYKITRERIRQIYFKERRVGVRVARHEETMARKQTKLEARKQHMEEIKMYCIVCGAPSYYKDRSKKYCAKCKSIWQDQNRDPGTTFSCRQCDKEFHPFRNWRYLKTKPTYCSQECYMDSGFFPPNRRLG